MNDEKIAQLKKDCTEDWFKQPKSSHEYDYYDREIATDRHRIEFMYNTGFNEGKQHILNFLISRGLEKLIEEYNKYSQ